MKTNITIKIDSDLAQDARVYAARHGTSLRRLIAVELEQLVRRDQAYDAAMKKALKDMSKAPDLGFQRLASRDELHGR